MQNNSALFPNLTVGLDLGDKTSRTCEVDGRDEVIKRAWVATNALGERGIWQAAPEEAE